MDDEYLQCTITQCDCLILSMKVRTYAHVASHICMYATSVEHVELLNSTIMKQVTIQYVHMHHRNMLLLLSALVRGRGTQFPGATWSLLSSMLLICIIFII